jgi:hypothetical protein
MVCSRQPRSFRGVDSHGRPDKWIEGQRDEFKGRFISSRLYLDIVRSHCPSGVRVLRSFQSPRSKPDLPGLPLSRAQSARAGPLENLHSESAATVLPTALSSREHKTPFPSPVTDKFTDQVNWYIGLSTSSIVNTYMNNISSYCDMCNIPIMQN